MTAKEPRILIYAWSPDTEALKQVCAGIEEEGVPVQVPLQSQDTLDNLAYEAAQESVLGSGIGMIQKDIALQLAGCPKGKNVFTSTDAAEFECRNIGANSARAVKRLPFRI